ncbi:MAG TPA: alpha/beta family hydrolase [Mycobacteriales bacterium]|nr:alpha/beta family hydrolase [Mycobacteriales bacterium]
MAQVETRRGLAAVHLSVPERAPALVLLGHGAGGDSSAPALAAVATALLVAGVAVASFDQPDRVAGRRMPAPAPHLDAAAMDVVHWLRSRPGLASVPLVVGGKSSGARVACRTAHVGGAVGVVALGFPLHPPTSPGRSRAAELHLASAPVLVCQGSRDIFGSPAEVADAGLGLAGLTVHAVAGGDHSFRARQVDGRTTAQCLAEVADVVVQWVGAQTGTT